MKYLLSLFLSLPLCAASYTVNLGGTAEHVVDIGHAYYMIATPVITPSGVTALSWGSCNVYYANPDSSNPAWGCAIYSDSGGSPGALLCAAFSSSAASAGWNTLTPSNCPTPAANTKYWIAEVSASSTQEEGHSGAFGTCPLTGLPSYRSNDPLPLLADAGSWPLTFGGASSMGNGCYSVYATLSYTSTASYVIVSFNQANCIPLDGQCKVNFAPFGSGHSLLLINFCSAGCSGAITPTDSASDTFNANGTCPTPSGYNTAIECFFNVNRATAGASWVNIQYASLDGHTMPVVLEIAGTAASASFDQSAYDSAFQTTPFTSATTGTTGQATEFLLGACYNKNLAAGNGGGSFTASGSWTLLYQGQNWESAGNMSTMGVFTQTSASTGTFNVTGSFSTAGTSNICALATYK